MIYKSWFGICSFNTCPPNTEQAHYLTATRIPPGRAWEAIVIIISIEGLHNNMLNGDARIHISLMNFYSVLDNHAHLVAIFIIFNQIW